MPDIATSQPMPNVSPKKNRAIFIIVFAGILVLIILSAIFLPKYFSREGTIDMVAADKLPANIPAALVGDQPISVTQNYEAHPKGFTQGTRQITEAMGLDETLVLYHFKFTNDGWQVIDDPLITGLERVFRASNAAREIAYVHLKAILPQQTVVTVNVLKPSK